MTTMDVLNDYPSEIDIGNSEESFRRFLESQKLVFHGQIDQLQNIVVTQCKLTGANPLSQEMAAGALSIKIGKRPRDLLNPKAVKFMQSIFSIKDAVSKKESREISALFGLTVTQVREFFASQRSRVRRFVRLSKEKANITCENRDNAVSSTSNSMMPLDPLPLSSFGPSSEEGTSSIDEEKLLHGIGESDKHFANDIFNMMRREETFSGQVKLMEWIIQIENPSVLTWFLLKGGLMILATWLSQAATEEQTTILLVTLRVLCHLPLHQAPSSDISAIIQSVNKLRFYGRSDISNRARILLSRWSKLLATIEAMRKPNGMKSSTDAHSDLDLKQRINELTEGIPWQSPADVSDDTYGSLDYPRNMEAPQAMKLLTSSEDANRKHILGVSSTHNKERRKVRLVEQPGQKPAAKSPQAKTVCTSQPRPITADEIQKAKIRAQFMQSKYGTSRLSSIEGNKTKMSEGPKKASTVLTSDLFSASEAYLRPKLEAQKKARLLPVKNAKQIESRPSQKPKSEQKDPLSEKCQNIQIPWLIPPDIQLNEAWRVGTGQGSKEVEVQRNRNRREPETVYQTATDIPPNPKEPWDREMDYDDSLTPDIPIEQLPDADTAGPASTEPSLHHQAVQHETSSAKTLSASLISPSTASVNNNVGAAEPDLELLAVLLKNPELVFALTSGQASGLSSEDTTKLLDMIKSSGANGLVGNRLQQMSVEVSLPSPTPTPSRDMEVSLPSPTPPSRDEVSLPSPTPSRSHGLGGWKPETAKNPFARPAEAIPEPTVAVPALDAYRLQGTTSSAYHQYANTISSSVSSIQHPAIGIQPEMLLLSLAQKSNQNHLLNTHHQYPMVKNQNQVSEMVYLNQNHQSPSSSSLTPSYSSSIYSVVSQKSAATNIRHSPSSSVPGQSVGQQQQGSLPQRHNYDAWGGREVGGLDANPHSHSNFHKPFGGGSMRPGHLSWGSTEYPRQGRPECETWSPEDSPSRYPDHHVRQGGRSYQGQRMNSVGRFGPSHNAGSGSGGYESQQPHWQGNRRWSDRARRR